MRTPPHALVLSVVEDAGALEALADDARAVFGELPGGPGPPTPPGGSRSSGAAGRPAEPRRVMA
ncbi:MAG TPA: hypothetical protein VHH55_01905, partial [Gaiellaceae bacterium]|nr:hypothetical protein [Gaiellaceae bacterium]